MSKANNKDTHFIRKLEWCLLRSRKNLHKRTKSPQNKLTGQINLLRMEFYGGGVTL